MGLQRDEETRPGTDRKEGLTYIHKKAFARQFVLLIQIAVLFCR
jgi:hypothetical protein